jgi:hypothetical protein
MSFVAFWLSNCLLLLYYLRKEPNLFASTKEYQTHLSDLINEIFVFLVRDAEHRISKILEPSMLEFEGVGGFEDVNFVGDWGFVRKFTIRGKKKENRNSAMGLFVEPAMNSPGKGSGAITPEGSPRIGDKKNGLVGKNGVMGKGSQEKSPRSITSLLSSTLFVLQCYDIHPSIVVQLFSQLFYWLACEVFNRIMMKVSPLISPAKFLLNVSYYRKSTCVDRKPSRFDSMLPNSKNGLGSTDFRLK